MAAYASRSRGHFFLAGFFRVRQAQRTKRKRDYSSSLIRAMYLEDLKTFKAYLYPKQEVILHITLRAPGGYITKFNMGRLRPVSNPLPFYILFWQKRHPFYIAVIENTYPFHIPTLGSLVLINFM